MWIPVENRFVGLTTCFCCSISVSSWAARTLCLASKIAAGTWECSWKHEESLGENLGTTSATFSSFHLLFHTENRLVHLKVCSLTGVMQNSLAMLFNRRWVCECPFPSFTFTAYLDIRPFVMSQQGADTTLKLVMIIRVSWPCWRFFNNQACKQLYQDVLTTGFAGGIKLRAKIKCFIEFHMFSKLLPITLDN